MRAERRGVRTCEVRATFRAPLAYVYRWCTDYAPDDGRRAEENYVRRILERSDRRVVLEDLEDTEHGWVWKRSTVTLDPPRHWHAESDGNYRYFSLDYRLRALPGGVTELTLRGKRTATALGGENPTRARLEAGLRTLWTHLGRSLEREYRADMRRARSSAGRRRSRT